MTATRQNDRKALGTLQNRKKYVQDASRLRGIVDCVMDGMENLDTARGSSGSRDAVADECNNRGALEKEYSWWFFGPVPEFKDAGSVRGG
jgi:hypothetical protein